VIDVPSEMCEMEKLDELKPRAKSRELSPFNSSGDRLDSQATPKLNGWAGRPRDELLPWAYPRPKA
jgi:hypothetical protein